MKKLVSILIMGLALAIMSGCGGGSDSGTLAVTPPDVGTPEDTSGPVFKSTPNVTIPENTVNVSTVLVQGKDPAGTVTLSITGGNDRSLFNFDPESTLLSFETAPDFETPLDADKNNVYKVEITAIEGSTSTIQKMEITVEDIGKAPLQIVAALYDNKGTTDDTDDRLFVYFDTQIDDGSGSDSSFLFSDSASISGATFEYTVGSPYKLTASKGLSGFVQNTTIKVSAGGLTVDGEEVLAGTPVTVTAMQVIVTPGDRSFTLDDTNETIVDHDLGLTWQNVVNTKQEWSDAIITCEDLALNGSTDWRLPNIHELVSITNKTKTDPAIYQEFNQSVNDRYWSSTSYKDNDLYAWGINIRDAGGGGDTRTIAKTASVYVRCVRGEPKTKTESTFIRDAATNTVYDTTSGLFWDDTIETQEENDITWEEARVYCEDNRLGGHTSWRLPNFNELQSIVNYEVFLPAIYAVFIKTNSAGHWTSTEAANSVTKAWSIRFSAGEGLVDEKDTPSHIQSVRCVRDAQ